MNQLPPWVSMGRGTYWANAVFHRWGNETISIGSFCSIAQEARFIAGGGHRRDCASTYPFDVLIRGAKTASPEDRCYEHGAGISVGSDVHVGLSATVCGNVKIGHGAVIAANATVFTDVPPYGIAVGNPARVTKFRFDEKTIEALLRIAWWEWPEDMIRAHANSGTFYWPIAEFTERFLRSVRKLSAEDSQKQHSSGVVSCA